MTALFARLSRPAALTAALTVCCLAPSPARAQQPSAAEAMKLFASAGDVSALIARAKAERKADQPNFSQSVVKLGSYGVNLEYRVGGLRAPASVHEKEAEIFFVVEGSGTAVTGGTLRDEKRSNAANLSGTGIDGGESRKLSKGDVLLVPESTPHWFEPETGGALVLFSLHLPRP